MNPAKAFLHLFSPLGGDEADNYRSPGQISFLRAPFVPIKREAMRGSGASYAYLGAPYDEGNVGKPGCEDGAREFRVASLDYFPYWFEFNVDLQGTSIDCGDVQMPRVNPEVAHQRVYAAVREVLAAGLIPIVCGGDRSVSIPTAKAFSDHLGPDRKMGYMHLGAHLDMADSWAGEKNVSTCALARITELGNLDSANVAHIGARNSFNPKDHVDLARQRGIRFHPMFEVLERGIDNLMDEAVASVWDGTDGQYLSFNFNVMDSSAAPGVTATEPGGLESREIMQVAARIAERGGPGIIDVTELCPMFDVSGSTSRMAVCVVMRIMAGVAANRGQTVDETLRRPGWQHG
ncbi:MAG: agmatinase family protein [Rhodospirillaceae bacterium]|nr:agmatinase family protein [Rhodospirillaceae bacterium]MCY4066972.1 agmatinase family protein [Rhodospirillaceae bacterium]